MTTKYHGDETMKITISGEAGFYTTATITSDECGRGVDAHDQTALNGDVQDEILAAIDAYKTYGTVVIDGDQMMWECLTADEE